MSANTGETTFDPALIAALERAAAASTLLVACDYDGTLAPLVDDPDRATPLPGTVEALAELATVPGTWVSLVSGRSLKALVALACPPRAIGLIGSHGAEHIPPTGPRIDLDGQTIPDWPTGNHELADLADLAEFPAAEAGELLAELVAEVSVEVARLPGSRLETKPVGVAFHYRQAEPTAGASAADALIERLAARPGVHVRAGKMVAEFAVAGADKGEALRRLVAQTAPDVTVFVGDDVTDEDAFAVLSDGDVTIKVGPGATAAAHRVGAPDDVLTVLKLLTLARCGGDS